MLIDQFPEKGDVLLERATSGMCPQCFARESEAAEANRGLSDHL